MKKYFKLCSVFMAIAMLGMTAVACNDKEEASVGESSSPVSSTAPESSAPSSNSSSEPEEVVTLPTASKIVEARQQAVQANTQTYDFTLNLGGTVEALGFSQYMEANYDGEYRYNKTTEDVQFKRVTSGLLLYNSTEYVTTKNDSQIKVVLNDKGEVKKAAAVTTEDELGLVNKPIVAIVDALDANNIVDIAETSVAGYDYQAKIKLASDNQLLNAACTKLGGFGTSISLKGVTFANPASGIDFYFNLDVTNGLVDFKIETDILIPIKAVNTTLKLTYKQNFDNGAITVPEVGGLILNDTAVEQELLTINNSITALKTQEAYSLDVVAENEFDPAWNVLATVDKYTARLYKNTVNENVWFNHSYAYKSHHEEDGAETYKYTIGNLQDNTVHCISRKGSNVINQVENVTVDTQFDYIVRPAMISAENVDCIKKTVDGKNVTYSIYLNENGMGAMQNSILDMINSNTAEGVLKTENYFNSEYMIKEAEVVVEMVDGAIKSFKCLTELKYCPTGGEYTEYNITLTNKLELLVNEKLSDAQEYEAPAKAAAVLGIGGLKYIL